MSDFEECGFIDGAVVPVDGGRLWGAIPKKRELGKSGGSRNQIPVA